MLADEIHAHYNSRCMKNLNTAGSAYSVANLLVESHRGVLNCSHCCRHVVCWKDGITDVSEWRMGVIIKGILQSGT